MKLAVNALLLAFGLLSSIGGLAQSTDTTLFTIVTDTTIPHAHFNDVLNDETDLVDVFTNIWHRGTGKRKDTGEIKSSRLRISAVPAAGYTLQTGFAALVSANAAFYTRPDANVSTLLSSLTYTERNQIILPLQTSIWTRANKYNIVIDWRYLKYPSFTYGLGGYTTLSNGYTIDYSALRIHQTILRELAEDMYAGIGYKLDYFYGINELNPPVGVATDFQTYGLHNTEFASGFTFNFLYDTRKNPINPQKGNFVNVVYRPNLTIFGNTASWRSLVVDVRRYMRFPRQSRNVFAVWIYDWFTVSGKAPYLMLPNTGGDPYSNTGRGYIQGRYRGNNMAYLEGEYRFRITNNGLLGGVVFANAQTFSEQTTNSFETIAPAYGLGLRVRLNKFTRTNLAIDYGFGKNGSSGIFVNLGEVF